MQASKNIFQTQKGHLKLFSDDLVLNLPEKILQTALQTPRQPHQYRQNRCLSKDHCPSDTTQISCPERT